MNENEIVLPSPQMTGHLSLEEILARRRSRRTFAPDPLTWQEIGQLAWAAQGITGSDTHWRTTPSAGALHPLELYLLLPDQSYHYRPAEHKLVYHQPVSFPELASAALDQRFVAKAPCIFVFSGHIARVTRIYKRLGRRHLSIDLGHATQNLLLQATALGLASTPVSVFDSPALQSTLRLPPDEEPLYLIPVGHPAP